MKLDLKRIDVWAIGIEDRPGGLAKKLDALLKAGANLEFLVARRAPEKPGEGVAFVTPIKGARQVKAAKEAGFRKAESMHSVRIDGQDRPGLAAEMTQKIAEAGINLRGLSAASMGKHAVFYLAFDSVADANKAIRCLRQSR
ncbi:MAG TPA: ACT domain-containing protein [Sedimentisphaerales bacterium]|nr:ACT domain-containing protein [Sedimentisphaerales bacterium]